MREEKRQEKKKLEKDSGQFDREWDFRQTAPRESTSVSNENEKVSDKSLLSNRSLLRTIFSGGRDSDERTVIVECCINNHIYIIY